MQASSWCHVIIFRLLSPLLYPPKYVSSESFLGYTKKNRKVKENKMLVLFGGGLWVGFFPLWLPQYMQFWQEVHKEIWHHSLKSQQNQEYIGKWNFPAGSANQTAVILKMGFLEKKKIKMEQKL